MRDLLPNGLLGLAIAGLLAAFMAGMAANISAFNTVLSYDLWQTYIVKEREDELLPAGRADRHGRGHRDRDLHRRRWPRNFSNIMNYLQVLFGFFNAPLFATFILGMFWKRLTAHGRLDGSRRRDGVRRRGGLPQRGRVRLAQHRRDPARRAGCGLRGSVGRLPGRPRCSASGSSLVTKPRDPAELRRAWSTPRRRREDLVDPNEASYPWYRRTLPLAGSGPGHGHRAQRDLLRSVRCPSSRTVPASRSATRPPAQGRRRSTSATSSAGSWRRTASSSRWWVSSAIRRRTRPAASTPTCGPVSPCSSSGAVFLLWATAAADPGARVDRVDRVDRDRGRSGRVDRGVDHHAVDHPRRSRGTGRSSAGIRRRADPRGRRPGCAAPAGRPPPAAAGCRTSPRAGRPASPTASAGPSVSRSARATDGRRARGATPTAVMPRRRPRSEARPRPRRSRR